MNGYCGYMMSHRVEHSKRNSISTHAHVLLRFSIERGARQVSLPSFTVEIPMLSLVTALVSIGNILRYWRHMH